MDLGNQIHELRKKHNLSQEQLAEKVGVARQTISKWELGETSPDIKQAKTLSEIFNISLDELVGNKNSALENDVENHKKRIPRSIIKKVIVFSAALICLCLVIVGVFSIINRSQILHPQGIDGNVVITKKDPIRIGKGSVETIVFSEDNNPTIVCELPEGFVTDAERAGLYIDGSGNFIKFNADYESNVVNPLFGTEYYSYYEDRGYHSYMDMARMAMYCDFPKLGVLSSTEEIYLAGGAQLIREQLCAAQNADYYEIDGGLTESGDETRIYGFALHFENTIWLITLMDCNNNYYYLTVKDPSGVGKSSDTIGELLSSINVIE